MEKENEKEKFDSFSKGPLIMKERTPYVLNCNHCKKKSVLSLQEYQKQLDDTKHDGFVCVYCGSEDVSFDEVNYKEIMGVERRYF